MSREDGKLRKHLEERAKRERRLAKKYSSQHGGDLTSRHTGPVATGRSGREPLLCINKIDLRANAAELAPVRPYQHAGVPVIHCSAATGEGIAELAEALAGKLCVFAGHSGVGKSSLLNALDPR